MKLALLDPRSDPLYASELDLRYRVLRAPLGMGEGEVTFDGENDALHVAAVDGEQVIGCVLFDWKSGRLRAMAVEPVLQGLGIGARLVESLEREVQLRGVHEVRLHARVDVVGFYERLGYGVHGDPFVELGIPHQAMTKAL